MKKILSLLSIFSFSCGSIMPSIGCGNIANNKPHLTPTKPKKTDNQRHFLLWKIKTRNYSRN